jgi:PAS domain S-box-containing protein
MFNWFCWRGDLKDKVVKPSVASIKIEENLESSISETRAISNRIIRKLEAKLEDRETLLAEVFNTIDGFLCLKDAEGRWKLLNTFGKRLYGLEGIEYKEKIDAEIAEISPRYANSLRQCVHTDNLAWNAGETIQIEERSIDSFDKESIFEVTKTPIYDEDGNKKYLLIHGVNVTEEYENTKHITMLVKALDQASDSIIVTDNKHAIIYANKAYLSCTGYTLKEILGQKADFQPTNDNIKINLKDTIMKGEIWQGSVLNRHKDGSMVDGVLTITPVLNGKPYPIYYIGVKRLTNKESK